MSSTPKGTSKLCLGLIDSEECDELFSIVPLVLIFMSQFVLGVGNTMYYALGQTYLDDNTKVNAIRSNSIIQIHCIVNLTRKQTLR